MRELVANKLRWSSPKKPENLKAGFRGWHERGYLPHRDEPGLTQFVTFRLADSFPAALRSEWAHLLNIENDRERRKRLEAYLDKGRGNCHLRNPGIAKLVEEALLHGHNRLYDLHAWVIMPNHVHTLFTTGNTPMSRILEDWKKYTAKEANKKLKRRGAFWEADYWDTFMPDSQHATQTRRYIENNPAKAGLVLDPKRWLWSSARFRDEKGDVRISS